jgi:hypothetical protein
VVTGDAELAAAIESGRTGRSAWRFFMIAALAFLLLECLLADRMLVRGRSKAPNHLRPRSTECLMPCHDPGP